MLNAMLFPHDDISSSTHTPNPTGGGQSLPWRLLGAVAGFIRFFLPLTQHWQWDSLLYRSFLSNLPRPWATTNVKGKVKKEEEACVALHCMAIARLLHIIRHKSILLLLPTSSLPHHDPLSLPAEQPPTELRQSRPARVSEATRAAQRHKETTGDKIIWQESLQCAGHRASTPSASSSPG